MARSISSSKLISSVADRVSAVISRRYAAAAAQGAVSGGGRGSAVVERGGEAASRNEISWVPDPVTGHYRPERAGKEVDGGDDGERFSLEAQSRRNS
ncbi:unnamed protein product [Cuscuta campestris]|uniref:Uncharacterized protein n=2 Tax=Cuscuta sect. Cleistogrammica TaxID=1824901 RepID=A0A484KFF8_9ASTE|nr:hypothetical protein DM860_006832 [Cuscuta australis]VFQ63185.1 unnamed protein product [Cuscuta campestris]